MKRRPKAPAGIIFFKKKVSALHAEMFLRIMKNREIEPASLGEMLEDMGNEFLNLSEEIRRRILASHRSAGRAGSCRAAGGNHR